MTGTKGHANWSLAKKALSVFCAFALAMSMIPSSGLKIAYATDAVATLSSATFSGGTGTEADPYVISNSTDMEALTNAVAGGETYSGTFFKVSEDIVLSNTVTNWTPIGDATKIFAGTFDGNSKTISGLTITSSTGYAALFGNVSGTVKNLTVDGTITSTTTEDYVAGIVAKLSAGGTISNCKNNVAVTATSAYNVGGVVALVGEKGSFVSDANPMATVSNCENDAQINGKKPVGGIAAHNAGTIQSCVNKGTIIGNNGASKGGYGGICGYNGINNLPAADAGIVKDCYNLGYVNSQGSKWAGGIAGFQNGKSSMSNCYNAGLLNFSATRTYPIVGQTEGTTNDCLWLKEDTSTTNSNYVGSDGVGLTDDDGGTSSNIVAKTRSELQASASATFLNTNSTTSAVDTAWIQSVSSEGFNSFPILSWQRTNDPVKNPVEIKFTLDPLGADLIVTTEAGKVVTPTGTSNGVATYTLEKDATYSYTVTKDNYATYQKTFVAYAGNDIDVKLHTLQVATNTVTGGEAISAGGTYKVVDTTPGTITINTTDKVVLVGTGFADSSKLSNISFDASAQNSNIEVRDMFVSLTQQGANLFDFGTTTSTISFEGISIFDYDANFTSASDAVLHIAPTGTLTLAGSGTYYQYNNTQGAGIGGTTGEMNGDIVFDMTGSAFIKGTRQGAVIGAGAKANGTGTPGKVTFKQGEYNLISNSRGAVIGGSAGSTGASEGTTVYIEGGTININCDYTGTAVGGGGYASGSDASGGTVYITGGNLRTYVDINAAKNVEDGYWHGVVPVAGVNNVFVTAQRKNLKNEDLYMAAIDVSDIQADANGQYSVSIDGKQYFKGSLNQYYFINEAVDRESPDGKLVDTSVARTCDNWQKSVDKHIYVYMTGETHEVTVNGKKYSATFDKTKLNTISECNGDIFTLAQTKYDVTFNSNGGSSVSKQTVNEGEKATKPANPTKAGYTFAGWYTDSKCTKAFNFSTAIKANTTLYAKWTANTTATSTSDGKAYVVDPTNLKRLTMTLKDASNKALSGVKVSVDAKGALTFSLPSTYLQSEVVKKSFTVTVAYDNGAVVKNKAVTLKKSEGTTVGTGKTDSKGQYSILLVDTTRVKMYRLYNPYTGEHFYTADANEQKNLVKVGWRDEGTGWYAPTKTTVPVYRLYNKYAPGGDHHYTMKADERDTLIKAGWSYEGEAWYSCENSDSDKQVLYRQYNPNAETGTHNYTLDEKEAKNVVAAGWNDEGTAWYGYATEK